MKLSIALWILLLLGLVASCDPLVGITLVNETSQPLAFYAQSDVQAALLGDHIVGAGSSIKTSLYPADFVWLRVAATREDGEWVFDHTYTQDEFEKAGSRVVASSLDFLPPPAGVRVIPSRNAPDPVVPPVTFANSTQERLELYTKSDVEAALAGTLSVGARSTLDWGKIAPNFAWLRVAATREDGQWVFEQMYTWDELERAKRRIVVTSLEPIAPPTNVRVVPREGAPPPALPTAGTEVAPGSVLTPGPGQATQTAQR
ncbi:MAG: hypothetical protein M1358_18690 [Chloroflexi bacterium]|nr:hypothetical protein [Chloroflexota bacterium]